MIETMVIAGLPKEVQEKLFRFFKRHDSTSGLVRLASLEDLDSEIDDMIAEVNVGVVRAKWISRPGRSKESIAENLKREKRVGVLVELVGSDLGEETYEMIAKANKSHTLAIAILKSDKPGDKARQTAAAHLGHYVSASTKSAKIFAIKEVLAENPEVYPQFAEALHCWNAAEIALQGGPYEGDVAEKLGMYALAEISRIEDILCKAEEVERGKASGSAPQSRYGHYYNEHLYRLQNELRDFVSVAGDMDSSWLPEDMKAKVVGSLKEVADRAKLVGVDLVTAVNDATLSFSVADRETQLHDLLGRLREAKTTEETLAALSGCELFRGKARHQIAATLFRNEHLSYASMQKGYIYLEEKSGALDSPWKMWNNIGKNLYTTYPVNGILMCLNTITWFADIDRIREFGREAEFLAGVVDAIVGEGFVNERTISALLASDIVDKSAFSVLPCNVIWNYREKMKPKSLVLLGEVLVETLADFDLVVYDQFERMARTFEGTIAELATVCEAATAGNE